MGRAAVLVASALALALACGDEAPGSASSGESGSSTAAATTAADSGGTSTAAMTEADTSATTASTDATDPTDATTSTATSAAESNTDPTTTGDAGPIELYRGPVQGGIVPDWDPDNPRPLLMLGELAGLWITTLARVGDDGALSDNVAAEIVVWGWIDAPPLLYDGPVVGGAIPGWDADAPIPVVMLARTDADPSWVATLASIAADGSLGDNVADRIVVWGWDAGAPPAPTSIFSGPPGGTLPAWDPDAPQPLVMLGRLDASDTWQSTLATIAPDGTLGGNAADQLEVWGW